MPLAPSTPSRGRFAIAAVVLEVLLAVGALAGGLALMLGPRGEIIPLPLSALRGSAFDTYLVPGLILFAVLGLGPLVAALMAWARHPLAPLAVVVVGVALLIWIMVEVTIVGYSNDPPLQPIYFLMGVAITLVGLGWLRAVGPAALHRRPSLR